MMEDKNCYAPCGLAPLCAEVLTAHTVQLHSLWLHSLRLGLEVGLHHNCLSPFQMILENTGGSAVSSPLVSSARKLFLISAAAFRPGPTGKIHAFHVQRSVQCSQRLIDLPVRPNVSAISLLERQALQNDCSHEGHGHLQIPDTHVEHYEEGAITTHLLKSLTCSLEVFPRIDFLAQVCLNLF